jgi:hypothetical protein
MKVAVDIDDVTADIIADSWGIGEENESRHL